jgi:hypothetical protein
MSYFTPINTAVENARAISHSALPDAPQVPHQEPRPSIRARVGAVLRSAAAHELRLANRIDPTPTCPTPANYPPHQHPTPPTPPHRPRQPPAP